MVKAGAVERAVEKISSREVRGASAIARYAAETLRDYIQQLQSSSPDDFKDRILKMSYQLKGARPTAVSLPNTVDSILIPVITLSDEGQSVEDIRSAAVDVANRCIEEIKGAIDKIGEFGAKRLRDGDVILTHSDSRAALSVLKHAHDQGKKISVINTETRPQSQGYQTSQKLCEYGIDTTMIIDSCVRIVIDDVDKVVVGADAIAVNGAVVSKIGTSQIATLANEARVKVMVAAETYKLDHNSIYGALIELEERDPAEVIRKDLLGDYPTLKIRNPQFDVTPPEYIDVLISERGLIPPSGVFSVMREIFKDHMKFRGQLAIPSKKIAQ